MDILSFLLGIAGEIAKEWIIDLIRGEKAKTITPEQIAQIKDLIEKELRSQSKTLNISTEALAKQVIEQMVLLSQNPDFPINISNGKVSLREPAKGKPLLGSPDKWAEKEIASRLYKMNEVIRQRQSEFGHSEKHYDSPHESIKAKSKLPPLENEPEIQSGWRQRLEQTAEQIEKRRQSELKSLMQNGEDDE